MNDRDNELRIKVATLCGYRDIGKLCVNNTPRMELIADGYVYSIPDYTNDLNACHEFEIRMRDTNKLNYILNLWDVLELGNKFVGMNVATALLMQTATARQRCEAFVKTMEGEQ